VLDIEIPEQMVGKSLLDLITAKDSIENSAREDTTFGELIKIKEWVNKKILLHSITTLRWKFVKDRHNNTYELFDLQEDPFEKTNVADEYIDVVSELDQILEIVLKDSGPSQDEQLTGRKHEFSEEIIEELKAFGYLH
jgi:hypothetical protein